MTNPFHPYPKPKLTVELVPTDQWSKNLRTRSIIKRETWDALRRACYVRANHKCEICGGVGRRHPVECHEIWDYNDNAKIQKLLGLIALCPDCHQVKHIGLAAVRGKFAKALGHLMEVNQWPVELAEAYVTRQFEIHQIRSRWVWSLDLSWLDNAEQYVEQTSDAVRQTHCERAVATIEAITRSREARQKRIDSALIERPVE